MLVESKTKAEILSVPILQERKGLSDPPGAQTQSIRPAVIYLRTEHENLSIASRVGGKRIHEASLNLANALTIGVWGPLQPSCPSLPVSLPVSPPPLKPKAVRESDHLRRSKGRRDFRH